MKVSRNQACPCGSGWKYKACCGKGEKTRAGVTGGRILAAIVGVTVIGGVVIAINLQTSFLTPPFGFSLFYLRGVAPREIPTTAIYRGVVPFIVIQLIGLGLVLAFPELVTAMLDR